MTDKCVCCGAVVPEGRMVCPMCEKKTFGEKLRALRKEIGYTQGELAEKIGININILSQYETDKVQPTIGRLEWLCTALNVSATELLGF